MTAALAATVRCLRHHKLLASCDDCQAVLRDRIATGRPVPTPRGGQ